MAGAKGGGLDQSMQRVMARVEAFLYGSAILLGIWILWSRAQGG